MPPLRNVSQDDAVKAFCRLGGVEKRGGGKGSHKKVELNGVTLIIPGGTIKIGVLKGILRRAGVSQSQFQEAL